MILRNTAKALIRRENEFLVLRKHFEDHDLYTLPGGSQEPGESLVDALRRECLEEIDIEPIPGRLLWVYEFEKVSSKDPDRRRHKVEFVFECSVPEDYSPRMGSHPDPHQNEVLWLDLGPTQHAFRPVFLPTLIRNETGRGYQGKLLDTSEPPVDRRP